MPSRDTVRVDLATFDCFQMVSSQKDILAIEARGISPTMPSSTFEVLQQTAARLPNAPALKCLRSDGSMSVSVEKNYSEFLYDIRRAANGFRELGVGRTDVIAYLLPNLYETQLTIWGGEVAGIAAAINPYLEVNAICSIIDAYQPKVLVATSEELNTDIWRKACAAAAQSSTIKTLVVVDENMRDFAPIGKVDALSMASLLSQQRGDRLDFDDRPGPDDAAAYFHTGGTTGIPKTAVHTHANQVFVALSIGGWFGGSENDVVLSGLPLFHVNALFSGGLILFASGGCVVMGPPAGFRDTCFVGQFWSLVRRHQITMFSAVPTVLMALLQIPHSPADLSSLRFVSVGAAPMPPELFERFEQDTGLKIIEGYGLTEGTCVSSLNPVLGERKVGSIGLRLPFQQMRVVKLDDQGQIVAECVTNEVGHLILKGPNVFRGYLDENANPAVLNSDGWLNTGDLARQDSDGYFWLTGRSKDLIIRGGHNIDPAVVENSLSKHPDVIGIAAVGQPDAYSGEVPVSFVQLKKDSVATEQTLLSFATRHATERASAPVAVYIINELPLTAVGKIYKPALRAKAVKMVYENALAAEGIRSQVTVETDKHGGQCATVNTQADAAEVANVLGVYTVAWRKSNE